MQQVPREFWPADQFDPTRIEVWVDEAFLAQVFLEKNDILRISINRIGVDTMGRWLEDITWEQLMDIKRQIGRGEDYAVEVLPRDHDIVDVANMRHIWLLPEPVCGWSRDGGGIC